MKIIMNKKKRLLILTIPFLITLTGLMIMNQADAEYKDASTLRTIEAIITETRPNEYYSFKVTYTMNGEVTETWCTPSTFFSEIYQEGKITPGETIVLALIDTNSNTGTVFDSVPNPPEPEPVTNPDPEPEENNSTEPEPEEELNIPTGLERVSSNVGPTPNLVPPEGKVKLTIMTQPTSLDGVQVYPPPGVYYAEEGLKLLLSCSVENDSWEFVYWNLGMGRDGSLRKSGIGYQNYLRVTLDRNMVITGFLNEVI
jgi:hypothetical protein